MAKILFIDDVCPKPYDSTTLISGGQGGTESTVTRIADALATREHVVEVVQHNRTTISSAIGRGAHFVPRTSITRPDLVVGLRTPAVAEKLMQYPDAKKVIWMHDYNHMDFVRGYEKHLKGRDIKLLCVSQTHKMVTVDALLSQLTKVEGPTVDYIYNPIDSTFDNFEFQRKPKSLLYCSSPHKGLEHTLKMFEKVKAWDPEYTLTVCNPGYMQLPEGVTGASVRPTELAGLMNEHAALFHLNAYPETFGLVYGEAIACGLPIITSRYGKAVHELITEKDYYVDITDESAIIEKLDKWHRCGAPTQQLNEKFRMPRIIENWEKLL